MERFQPKGIDGRQMRIDTLSNPCKVFMALEVALGNQILTDDNRLLLRQEQNVLHGNMSELQKAELINHKIWLLTEGGE